METIIAPDTEVELDQLAEVLSDYEHVLATISGVFDPHPISTRRFALIVTYDHPILTIERGLTIEFQRQHVVHRRPLRQEYQEQLMFQVEDAFHKVLHPHERDARCHRALQLMYGLVADEDIVLSGFATQTSKERGRDQGKAFSYPDTVDAVDVEFYLRNDPDYRFTIHYQTRELH